MKWHADNLPLAIFINNDSVILIELNNTIDYFIPNDIYIGFALTFHDQLHKLLIVTIIYLIAIANKNYA